MCKSPFLFAGVPLAVSPLIGSDIQVFCDENLVVCRPGMFLWRLRESRVWRSRLGQKERTSVNILGHVVKTKLNRKPSSIGHFSCQLGVSPNFMRFWTFCCN